METGVAQPGLGDAIQGGMGNNPAEGARHHEADVVGNDEQNVRRSWAARCAAPTRPWNSAHCR